MRIAFVGKGGSGKTTCAALFSQYLLGKNKGNVWAIDADLNMHLAEQLGIDTTGLKHISDPDSAKDIKTYIRGDNDRIKELAHFIKTTPPGEGSNFIVVKDPQNYILQQYAVGQGSLLTSTVGSYQSPGIGTSCYHGSLAVLERMLSHTIDSQAWVVVDMVAGVDAFAGTLHTQFDLMVLVLEPTKKAMEVYRQYKDLSEAAGVWSTIVVIGNKITSAADVDFIVNHVDKDKLLGSLRYSDVIKEAERSAHVLDFQQQEGTNKEVLINVYNRLKATKPDFNKRLQTLHKLHRKYVAQAHIKDRFGDLTTQIDTDFDFRETIKNYDVEGVFGPQRHSGLPESDDVSLQQKLRVPRPALTHPRCTATRLSSRTRNGMSTSKIAQSHSRGSDKSFILTTQPTTLTTDQIKSACQRHGLSYIRHQRIPRGFINEVYHLNDDLIFKLYRAGRPKRYQVEKSILEMEVNIPKARLVASGVDPDSQRNYIIMSSIEGKPLDSCWHLATDQQREALVQAICGILKTIHQIDPHRLGLVISQSWRQKIADSTQHHLRPLMEQGRIDPDLAKRIQVISDRLLATLDYPTPDPRFCCFSDVHLGNFMVNEDFQLQGIVDLEGITWAPLDYPINTIIGITNNPGFYLIPTEKHLADKNHYCHLEEWYRKYHPDIFKHPYLDERARIYRLGRKLADLNIEPNNPQLLRQIEADLAAPIRL